MTGVTLLNRSCCSRLLPLHGSCQLWQLTLCSLRWDMATPVNIVGAAVAALLTSQLPQLQKRERQQVLLLQAVLMAALLLACQSLV